MFKNPKAEAGVATASTLLSAFSAAVGDGLLALGNKAGGTLTPAERHLQGLASGVPWAELKLAAAALSEAASLPLAADFQNGSGEDYGAPEAPPWVVGTGASPSRYGARAHERASGAPTPPRSAARAAGAERRESVDQWRQPGEHSLPRQSHAAAPFFKPHGADADSDAGYGGQLYRLGAGAGVGAGYAT
ncbi:hypothetical protein T492DRAFT_841371 [Pavlovales sp. CCMP2436]|nr:hypothetical protein T492DRAFT_841371 [Pavlovales sp. CCMP2436]